jgi:hypothetical protein
MSCDIFRRQFLKASAGFLTGGIITGIVSHPTEILAQSSRAIWKKRLTGADLDTNHRWKVAGTDLGIPYILENGSIGYLFGDTFDTPWPETEGNDWRSPVMLRSNIHPSAPSGIVFDSAAKVFGNGRAPEILDINAHGNPNGGNWPEHEITCIPNDGISFPETGRQIISFQSINRWNPSPWRSRYATLAYSDNGNDFIRVPNLAWWNTESNEDPFQMWTMQRDGEWVYVFSVKSGRQNGPMMLRRVRWREMFSPTSYEGWGWNGTNWSWGRPCSPILIGCFGEPSVRKLADGTWAMCYLNCQTGNIVSRTSTGPDRIWSEEKTQVTFQQEPYLYGGFIHPWSARGSGNLHIMVSKWTHNPNNPKVSTAYHVSQYVGTL